MSASSPELEALFNQISYTTYGADRLPLLYRALALATETEDLDDLYRIRLALSESAARVSQIDVALSAFSWVVEQHQSDPVRFPLHPGIPVLSGVDWMFGWLAISLSHSAALSRAQLEELLELMEAVYRRAGLRLGKVGSTRFTVALNLGDKAMVSELLDAQERFDRVNACSTCVDANLIRAQLLLGDNKAAFRLAERLLAGQHRCEVEPTLISGELVVPLLLDGQSDQAATYFARARDNHLVIPELELEHAANLIEAACVTGSIGYALQLFEYRLPRLAATGHSQHERMRFLTAAALLMEKATIAGHGDRMVRDTAGTLAAQQLATGPLTAANLASQLWKEAARLAIAFDERAGNTSASERLASAKALVEVQVAADLGIEEACSFSLTPQAPRTAAEWATRCDDLYQLSEYRQSLQAAEQALQLGDLGPREAAMVHAIRTAALATVLQQSSEVSSVDQLPDSEVVMLRDAFDQMHQAFLTADLIGRARIIETLGLTRYNSSWQPTPVELSGVYDTLTAEGFSPGDLTWLEIVLATALLVAGETEQAAAAAIACFNHTDTADSSRLTDARHQTGLILAGAGHQEAIDWLSAVIDDPDASQGALATAERARSVEYLRRSEFVAAAADAASASQRGLLLGSPGSAVNDLRQQASALMTGGDHTGAVRTLRRASELSTLIEGFDQMPLQLQLGQALLISGQADAAVEALQRADQLLVERGEEATSDAGFECAFLLGQAHVASGNPESGADILTQALDLAVETADDPAQQNLARALSSLFADYHVWEQALRTSLIEREAVSRIGNATQLLSVDQRIGILKCFLGEAEGLDELTQAEQRASELGQPWWAAAAVEAQAKGLSSLRHHEQAVATALRASDAYAAAGDEPARLQSVGLAAALLATQDRIGEARALLRPLVADSELGNQILGEQLAALDTNG
jgi:cellulose synthase operon protein C